MAKYKDKSAWNLARNTDWKAKRPAKQKLTKKVSIKGSKLYSVYVGTDDHDRMQAKLCTWSVTSLRKFKTERHIGIIKKRRNVRLFIALDDTYGLSKEEVSCSGEDGEEVLERDYFNTPQKAVDYLIKENTHYLKWLKTKPESTPETAAIDRMFSAEKMERKKVALERLNKRLNK